MQLQYGALRRADDPRLAKLELLRPKVFAAYVADVLAAGDEELSRAWRSRSAEDVQNDPRFIAHKCGFDTQIILHLGSGPFRAVRPCMTTCWKSDWTRSVPRRVTRNRILTELAASLTVPRLRPWRHRQRQGLRLSAGRQFPVGGRL